MAAPSITVYNPADQRDQTNWSAGVVKAGQPSNILTVQIWNNRGGSTALADLKDASIAAIDIDNSKPATDPITYRWLKVNCPNFPDNEGTVWSGIGGTATKSIHADSISEMGTIKGTANDGNPATTASKANYCTVNLKIEVPTEAIPGTYNFKTRINGYYVG